MTASPLTLTSAADELEAILRRRPTSQSLRAFTAGRVAMARTWSTVDGLRYLGAIVSDLALDVRPAADELLALRCQIAERLDQMAKDGGR